MQATPKDVRKTDSCRKCGCEGFRLTNGMCDGCNGFDLRPVKPMRFGLRGFKRRRK